MNRNLALIVAGLVLAWPAAADTLYKYRHPDGRIEYSSGVIRGAQLLEVIQTPRVAPAPAPRSTVTPAQGSAVDARINQRIAAREQAWLELREATAALSAAEARLANGLDTRGNELAAVAGSVVTATIDPNVPQTPAISPSESVGGPGGPQIGGAAPIATLPATPPPATTPPRRERDPKGPDAPKLDPQKPLPGAEGTSPPAPTPDPNAEGAPKPAPPPNPSAEGTPKPAPKPNPNAEGAPKPAPPPNPLAERKAVPGPDPRPAPPATPTTPAPSTPAPNTGVGAPQAAVTPAAGGAMTGRRGGGRSAEYQTRITALEMDVAVARSRVNAAQAAYNKLR